MKPCSLVGREVVIHVHTCTCIHVYIENDVHNFSNDVHESCSERAKWLLSGAHLVTCKNALSILPKRDRA